MLVLLEALTERPRGTATQEARALRRNKETNLGRAWQAAFPFPFPFPEGNGNGNGNGSSPALDRPWSQRSGVPQ